VDMPEVTCYRKLNRPPFGHCGQGGFFIRGDLRGETSWFSV
jgi:hypothetical protein